MSFALNSNSSGLGIGFPMHLFFNVMQFARRDDIRSIIDRSCENNAYLLLIQWINQSRNR